MNLLFHVFGTFCSGKSFVIKEILKQNEAVKWDIKEDFYVPHKILKPDKKLDFNKLTFLRDKIPIELNNFINKYPKKIKLIESSGINQTINEILQGKVIPVYIITPPEEILALRAEEQGMDITDVIKVSKVFREKMQEIEAFLPESLTPNRAVHFIQEKINDMLLC